ncbi:ribonuclease H-like domain-containing protein [Aeribacillus sp. FSL M8-0254]|uniref:ribonuclease H-like domain-containing protein n=1 Tax=Aeribacillus sp. FSL M8-0254 TaxID=2954577 RepID=UPI0030F5BB12
MSIKQKLNRLKNHIVHEGVLKKEQDIEIPYLKRWESVGVKPFFFDGQYILIREVEYPLNYRHGLYELSEVIDVVDYWNDNEMEHPLSAKGHKPYELFFFDTETTGLKGGAGNMIFLLGFARILFDKVVIKQLFLPAPGHEVALYQRFLSEVNIKTLVTYNGKAFDWPQVKTRHTLIRNMVPQLPEYGHFDLYHAARRLWKNRLESVKLSNVEKDILQVNRKEDTPGYLVPILYHHFLKDPNPDSVIGIFQHNEMDILSLISLYIHLSKKLLFPDDNHDDKELFEMARWFQAQGNEKLAYFSYAKINEQSSSLHLKAKFEMAMLAKRNGRLDEAVKLWSEIKKHGQGFLKIKALVELAKFYEHYEKNIDAAYMDTNEAIQILKQLERMGVSKHSTQKEELLKRKWRLEKKKNKLEDLGER